MALGATTEIVSGVGLDALKQAISAGFQHACNVAIASIARSEGGQGDEECGWYMISFTVDAVMGTALSLLMLKYALEPLARKFYWKPLAESGDYGQPDNINLKWWALQLSSWVIISIIARIFCGILVYNLHNPLYPFVQWLTAIFHGNGVAFLLTSMVGTPTVLNVLITTIIQDTVLKKSESENTGETVEEEILIPMESNANTSIDLSLPLVEVPR
eukprot:CAMPEP_0114487632 /NCGR_PEP_ID=MMETSP0109-20121206/881_1 /TAXON_ID=29199 /ORGANISM="Chlorarachnion reptans, Strain CCCM449" /LENGTH=215 /DNA_ID=CAMNT_0001663933 /DNA_START=36 /DNA_END=685 /DNA_ORIENTATION=-